MLGVIQYFRKDFLYLFFLCSCLLGKAQAQESEKQLDSLEAKFDKALFAFEDYDYVTALKEVIDIIEIAEESENVFYTFKGYNLMGYIQNASKDIPKSIAFQEKALAVARKSGADSLISWALNDLGNIYSETAQYEKGIEYYKNALEINRKSNVKEEEDLIPLMNIGWTYLDHNDHDKAYPYISKARSYTKSTKQPLLLIENLNILFGRYYLLNGNYNIAEKELNEALEVAEKNDFLDQASSAVKYLSQLYESQGKFEQALPLVKKQNHLDKQIYDLNKIQELEQANAKFEVRQYKRETELAKMEQQYTQQSLQASRAIIIASAIAGFLLLATLLILWRQYAHRRTAAKDLKEKKMNLL